MSHNWKVTINAFNQSINQSIDQPDKYATNQPINQSMTNILTQLPLAERPVAVVDGAPAAGPPIHQDACKMTPDAPIGSLSCPDSTHPCPKPPALVFLPPTRACRKSDAANDSRIWSRKRQQPRMRSRDSIRPVMEWGAGKKNQSKKVFECLRMQEENPRK